MNNTSQKTHFNKLTILSVISLLYFFLDSIFGSSLYVKLFDKIDYINYRFNIIYFGKIDYLDILFYFLEISMYLSLVIAIITGIFGLIKIRKTNEKGEFIALLSVGISVLFFLSYIYAIYAG